MALTRNGLENSSRSLIVRRKFKFSLVFAAKKNENKTMNAFIFKSATYDEASQSIILCYGYADGPSFREVIHFPDAKPTLSTHEREALDKTIKGLHLAAGISYYKAYCPNEIVIEQGSLNQEEADFFYKFYLMGLGEFSVENNLDLKDIINFPVGNVDKPNPSDLTLASKSVVPIGGGKDSIISLEALKDGGHPLRMIAINPGRPILDVMKVADVAIDPIHISRKLDPALFELNKGGAMNGHVPITGILSFIMACGSILYGYDSVVMSNEGSASEGNMEFGGIEVNHQYSKSLEFELDFEGFVRKTALSNFRYFSLLRPLTETGIAALFSKQEKYFQDFKSCNRNFHIDAGERRYGWCCTCPKCHFVFLALSAFVKRDKLISIFGSNILDDAAQEDGLRELCGLKGHKPFECVGEIEECQNIMKCLSTTEWKDDALVKKLSAELDIKTLSPSELKAAALTYQYDHNIPDKFLEYLNEFINAQR